MYGRIGFLSSQAILPTEYRSFSYTHAQLHKAHYKPLELWCGVGEADAPDAPVCVVYRENRQHAANRVLFKLRTRLSGKFMCARREALQHAPNKPLMTQTFSLKMIS